MIFISAYDIDPFKGSESGMGWNFVLHLSKSYDVFVVTRENNRANIDLYLKDMKSSDGLNFIFYDLPNWVLRLKAGNRLWACYYYLWQLGVAANFRKLISECDIAHNLNFHTTVMPSFLWFYNRNFVWGPVNHHEKIPWRYIARHYNYFDIFKSEAVWLTKLVNWYVNPFLLLTQIKAKYIIAGSSAVSKRLPFAGCSKIVPISSVGVDHLTGEDPHFCTRVFQERTSVFNILSVGRLVPLKGFDLTINSYKQFLISNPLITDTKLTIVGKGNSTDLLRGIAEDIPSNGKVVFVNWMARDKLFEFYNSADIFLFPSHEGAGMVVAEAMACGLPVVCLDNNGPAEIVNNPDTTVGRGSYDRTVHSISCKIERLYSDAGFYECCSKLATEAVGKYAWEHKAVEISRIYDKLLGLEIK